MTTLAAYAAKLAADQTALTALSGWTSTDYAYAQGVDTTVWGATWKDASGRVIASYDSGSTVPASVANHAADLAAAQASVVQDQTALAGASLAEAQLAASNIFTAQQSVALQSLSNSNDPLYLPSLRGYVVTVPPGSAVFAPDGSDSPVQHSADVGICTRNMPGYVAPSAAAVATLLSKYKTNTPIYAYTLGQVWRLPAQLPGSVAHNLVWTQLEITPLITAARNSVGAVTFDADPLGSITSYLTNLCLLDAAATKQADDAVYALAQANLRSQNSKSLLGPAIIAISLAAVVYGGIVAYGAMSATAAVASSAIPGAVTTVGAPVLADVGTAAALTTEQAAAISAASGVTTTGISSVDLALAGAVNNGAMPLAAANAYSDAVIAGTVDAGALTSGIAATYGIGGAASVAAGTLSDVAQSAAQNLGKSAATAAADIGVKVGSAAALAALAPIKTQAIQRPSVSPSSGLTSLFSNPIILAGIVGLIALKGK